MSLPDVQTRVRVCNCTKPRPWTDPRRAGWCVACLGKLPELRDDELRDFYRHVREMLAATGHELAGGPLSVQALERHEAGKKRFAHRWVGRDNAVEACEEASDGSNYSAYETIKARRLLRFGADASDVDAANIDFWTAAYYFALAHESLRLGREKLREAVED